MARWVRWSMRLLAAVNAGLVLVGLSFFGMTWWAAFALNAFAEVTEPHFWHFFFGFSALNLLSREAHRGPFP